jgi:hypothetical protein
MTGVDILAMEEVAVEFAFNWTWFWVVFAAFTLIGLIGSCCMFISGSHTWFIIPCMTMLFALVGATLGCGVMELEKIPTKYKPQYKVTISDEVSMTEFLEKYEIIETEGKIYTVREK